MKDKTLPSKTESRHIAGAYLFIHHTRDVHELARLLKVDERSIQRWATESPMWEAVLDKFQYGGPHDFRTSPLGEKHRPLPNKDGFPLTVNWNVSKMAGMYKDVATAVDNIRTGKINSAHVALEDKQISLYVRERAGKRTLCVRVTQGEENV